MIVRTEALVRLPDLSREEFQRHWRDHHAPLVTGLASALGIISYKQIHALTPEGDADPAFDGIAHVVFESVEALKAMLATTDGRSAARILRDDESVFLDRGRSRIVWGAEHSII